MINTKGEWIYTNPEIAYELANLIGYHGFNNGNVERPKIGDSIQISKMYKQLKNLSYREEQIDNTIKLLGSIAEDLKAVPPVIHGILNDKE
jgi:hypothetical protein